MIKEQQIKYNSDFEEISKQLSEKGKFNDQKENIELIFFEDKNNLKNKENNGNQDNIDQDKMAMKNNGYIVGKYKDIYIGCLSNNEFDSREKFGLNRYFNDIFYIGQWKENKKEGIGFLKLNENIGYLGHFSDNQINGFGMLYYKDIGSFYFGEFIDGQMDKGIYYNCDKSLFYHGKFINGKKNDNLCAYFDINNNNIYIGEVKDDIFIQGYLSLCSITEEKIGNEITTNFSCDKLIYFDKRNPDNIKYEHYCYFDSDFLDELQNAFMAIFEVDLNIKDIHDNYIAFFENLENIVYNDSYTEYIDRYNPLENYNIENTFIKNYEIYYKRFLKSQEKLDLKKYENIFKDGPKIDADLKEEIK